MKTVVVYAGIPASGKDTHAKSHYPDALVINADKIREELYGDESIQGEGARVFGLVKSRFNAALVDDSVKTIVLTNTNTKASDRKEYFQSAFYAQTASTEKFKLVLIYFMPDIKRAKKQNQMRDRKVPEDVIDRMASRLQPPTDWEKDNLDEIHSL